MIACPILIVVNRVRMTLVFVVALGVGGSSQCHATGEVAKQAFESAASFPWYDADAGTLQEIPLRKQNQPPQVKNWEWPNLMSDWDWEWDWNWSFGDFVGRIFEVLAWAFLIGLIASIVVLLIRAYLEGEGFGSSSRAQRSESDSRRSDAELIENLPFEIKAARTNLMSEASRLREEGRYGEALVYLFSHQLIQLDKRQFIRLTKGKTNRQYLREIASRPDLKRVVGTTMIAFEDFFFGNHEIGKARFDSLWNQTSEFDQIISSNLQAGEQLSVGGVH